MRIATYYDDAGTSHAAFQIDDRLVSAKRAAEAAGLAAETGDPACARGLLELGSDVVRKLNDAAGGLANGDDSISFSDAKLAPPVRTPEKILCAGLNYYSHAAEAGMEPEAAAPIFCKFINTLVGHNEPVIRPKNTEQLDWEGELLLVIGKEGKDISEDDALDHLAGVSIMNDVTARDLQFVTSQWYSGKGNDTFGPCGPSIVSLDEVGELNGLGLTTRVNGEVMQQHTTDDMVVKVPQLISYLSSLVTLKVGDLIATGTCEGIGLLKTPPRFMVEGDVVTVEIERVGTLSNPIVNAS